MGACAKQIVGRVLRCVKAKSDWALFVPNQCNKIFQFASEISSEKTFYSSIICPETPCVQSLLMGSKKCGWCGGGIEHILTHLPLMQQKFSLRCYDKSFRLFRACFKNASFSTTVSKCGPILLQESLHLSLYRFPPPFTRICLDDGGWKK